MDTVDNVCVSSRKVVPAVPPRRMPIEEVLRRLELAKLLLAQVIEARRDLGDDYLLSAARELIRDYEGPILYRMGR